MAFIYDDEKKKKQGLPEIVKPGQQKKTSQSNLNTIAKNTFPTQKTSSAPKTISHSWSDKRYGDVTYAEYKAFAQKTGAPQEVFDRLEYETTLPGSQFYNPYKGGNSTQMQAAKDAFRSLTGGDVTFDDNFFNQFNYLRNSVVRSETTGNLTTPNKNFTLEQTCAYWYEQALMDKQATSNVQSQYDEVRTKYAESYADFKAVYQREPTLDEFASFVDLSKYSALDKILNVSYDSADPQKVSQLNTGTFFDRDTVTGLYYAIQNGEDITVDRDYTEDAVNYYMNPVQSSPSIQKYPWSNVNLNAVDERGLGLYIQELGRLGEMEELAALRHAIWVSKPHKEGVVTESVLNDTYGYYHDNAWFEAAHAAVGDEYEVRLTEDGKMSKPGSNASLMDRACYELWQEEQKRAETDEVEAALEEIKRTIAMYDPSNYAVDEFDTFCRDVRSAVKGLDNYSVVEDYINGKTDTCRDIFVSEDTINAMIGRQWKGLSISENVDYGVTFAEGYEDAFTPDDTPEEPPMFYDEMQERIAAGEVVDRQNNKKTIAQAVFDFSQSGATVSDSEIIASQIIPETYSSVAGTGEILTSLWFAFRSDEYASKYGESFTFEQAAAGDMMLKAISSVTGTTSVRQLTIADIAQLGHLSTQSDIANDEMTMTAGLIENALPGLSYLSDCIDAMYDKYGINAAYQVMNGSTFNVSVYKNSYQQSIFAGVSPKAAAEKAFGEAVYISAANDSIKNAYAGDAELSAAAVELTQQIALEEGIDEVVEIVSNVASDSIAASKPPLGEDGKIADVTPLTSAMLVGSSSLADPGFSVMTKDLVHSIATGDITPEDINEAVWAHASYKLPPAPTAVDQEETPFVPNEDRTVLMNNGIELTAADYTALREEQERIMYGLESYDEMSDIIKQEIGYDALMAYADSLEATGMAVNRDGLLLTAVSKMHVEEDNGDYRPSELMHGATDIESEINTLASRKTPEQIAQNVSDQERTLIQQFIESDSYNFLPRIAAAFAGYSTTNTYHVVERLQNNSKYFSAAELSSMLQAYGDGRLTMAEVDAMIDDRIQEFPNEYINALNHPAALEESYATIDENLASHSDNEIYSKVAEVYKALGPYGFYIAGLDNEALKKMTGGYLDLDAAGTTALDVMNEIGGKNWTAPYSNDGSGEWLDPILRGLSDGMGNVMVAPHKLAYWFGRLIGDKSTGDTLDTYNQIDKLDAEYQRNVQTAAEAFLEQGVSEMTRILITSGFGAGLAGFTGKAAGLAQMSTRAKTLSKIAGRLPHAINVFANDSYDYLMKGEPLLKSTIKSSLHTAIELGTESLPLEKFVTFKIGGVSMYGRAMNTIGVMSPMTVAWVSQTAKNIVTEIGEEEISMILNHFVDGVDMGVQNYYNAPKKRADMNRAFETDLSEESSVSDFTSAFVGEFAGIKDEALATAQATAFTTLLLGVADLGGFTYQAIQMNMELGVPYDADDLIRDLEIDIAAASEEDSGSESTYDPATDVPYFASPKDSSATDEDTDTPAEESYDAPVETEAAEESEAEVVESESETEPEAEAISEEDKRYWELRAEQRRRGVGSWGTMSSADWERIAPAEFKHVAKPDKREWALKAEARRRGVGIWGMMSSAEWEKIAPAEYMYVTKASAAMISGDEADIAEAVKAAEEYEAELSAAPEEPVAAPEAAVEETVEQEVEPATEAPVASEEAAVEPTEEAPAESTEPAPEEAVEPPVLSTPGAETVFNYLTEAEERGVPEAVANAGAKAEAKAAAETDPRVKQAEEAVEQAEKKVAEATEEVSKTESEISVAEKQREQAVRASVEEGVDNNGSVLTNALAQLNQRIQALMGDLADQSAKLKKAQDESKDARGKIQKTVEEIEAEVKGKVRGDIITRIQQFKEQANREAEQYRNARRNKDGSLVVEELKTDERYQEDKAKAKAANDAMADRYAKGEVTVDEYTDPGYTENGKMTRPVTGYLWPITKNQPYTRALEERYAKSYLSSPVMTGGDRAYPVSSERYVSDWQEEQKASEEERQREEERRIRLTSDFVSSENSKGMMLEVAQDVYDRICENMRRAIGYVDTSHARVSGKYNDNATTSLDVTEDGGVVQNDADIRAGVIETDDEMSSSEWFNFDKNGTVHIADKSAQAAFDAIVGEASDTSGGFLAQTTTDSLDKKTVVDSKWDHVTENDQYLVIKKHGESAVDPDDQLSLDMYYKKGKDGKTGADRLRDRHDKAKTALEKARDEHIAAVEEKAKALEAFNSDKSAANAKAYKEADGKEQRAARLLDQARKDFNKAFEYLTTAANKVKAIETAEETRKKTLATYFAIDKKKLKLFDIESINAQARDFASKIMEEHKEATFDDLVEKCTNLKVGSATPEAQSVYELVRTVYKGMSFDDLRIELRSMIYKRECERLTREALNSSFQKITSKRSLDEFIAENGGEATSETEDSGKEFRTFTQRKQMTSKYAISEFALRKYGTVKDLETTGIDQKHSAKDFDAELSRSVAEYAKEHGMSDEDRDLLFKSLSLSSTSGKDRFHSIKSGNGFTLMIRNEDRNDPTANSWIRETDPNSKNYGNYSMTMVWQRIQKKMSHIVWGAENTKKVNPGRNSIEITYIDSKGKKQKRKFGDYFSKSSDDSESNINGYWMPSISWIRSNALEITCNFFCRNNKPNDTAEQKALAASSRINIKLFPDLFAERPTYDRDSVLEEDAYMRTREELVEEYKEAAEQFNLHPKNAYFRRVYLEAKLNGIINRMRQISETYNANGVTDDRRDFLVDEYRVLKLSHLVTLDELKSNEDSFANIGANQKVETGGGQTDYVQLSPGEAADLLQASTAIYEKLSSGDPQYDLPIYETQKRVAAATIERCRKILEANPSAAISQNDEITEESPKYTDKYIEEVVSGIEGKTYSTEEEFYDDLYRLRTMELDGANVSSVRAALIARYHEFKMKGMTREEKMDYLADVAERAKTAVNSYIIDPNADYESMLKQAIMGTDDLRSINKQLGRIRRMAYSYKTERGINNALKRLESIERAGVDVSSVRDDLRTRLAHISGNPLFLGDAPLTAADLDPYSTNYGMTHDEYMRSELESDDEGAPYSASTSDVGDQIDLQMFAESSPEGTLADVEKKTSTWRDDGVDTGFNSMIEAIEDANDLIHDDASLESAIEEIRTLGSDVDNLTSDINDAAAEIRTMNDRKYEIINRMTEIETETDSGWSSELVAEYNALHAELRTLEDNIASKYTEKNVLVDQRNSLKAKQQNVSTSVLASDYANDIINNRATFSPDSLKTQNKKAAFSDGRATAREMLNKVKNSASEHRVDGRLTVHTPVQLTQYYRDAIDEKTMAFDHEVATVLSRQAKEMKKSHALLELEKIWLANTNVVGGEEKIAEARASAVESIIALTPPKGYTDDDYQKEVRNREKAVETVNAFIARLESQFMTEEDIDREYRVVGEQIAAVTGAIERAEKAVRDYFSVAIDDLYGVMDGSKGGHTPHAVMQIDLAMVLDGAKKSKNPKHFIARNLDSPARVFDKFLGENADLFNSRYTAPVMRADAKIASRKGAIRDEIKAFKLTKEEGKAIFHALDTGMSEAEIMENYPSIADRVIEIAPYFRNLFDGMIEEMNVSLVRNGLDPVKRRSNYVPHIRREENTILRFMGINTSYDELPTALLGFTGDTTPAHQFNQHMLEREVDNVEDCIQDISEVAMRYANSTLPVIHQTDNIIRFDDLISAINDNVEFSDDLDYEKGKLSVFRSFVSDYRDNIAGKKVGRVDRAIEANVGRKYFGAVRAMTKLKGLSATMLNTSVIAANIIPLNTFFALDPANTITAVYQTIMHRAFGIDDGLMQKSSFYTLRKENQRDAYSLFERATNASYRPASTIDEIVAEIGVRSHLNSTLKRNGFETSLSQAMENADNFAYRVMADKNSGLKPMLYSTGWGSVVLQFTQEAVNNLSFIVNDLAAYEGVGRDGKLSVITGSAKALAALIAMFFCNHSLNNATGRNIAIDPYGAYKKAKHAAGEDGSTFDVVSGTVINLVESLNPMSSVTENGILGAPVVSGAMDVVESLWQANVNATEAVFDTVFDGEEFNIETDWASALGKAISNSVVPGGVAGKRILDTYNAARKGYTTTASGNIKYAFEPTIENIMRSVLFGTDSTKAGQDYIASGYRTLSEAKTRQMIELIENHGMSPTDAYRTVTRASDASTEASQVSAGKKLGADTSAHEKAASEARNDMEMPVEMSTLPNEYLSKPSVQKGIELWKETGEKVYMKPSMSFSTNNYETKAGESRKGIQSEGVFYELTDEEMEDLNKWYRREYEMILNSYDPENATAADLASSLSKMESRIKKDYIADRGDN